MELLIICLHLSLTIGISVGILNFKDKYLESGTKKGTLKPAHALKTTSLTDHSVHEVIRLIEK